MDESKRRWSTRSASIVVMVLVAAASVGGGAAGAGSSVGPVDGVSRQGVIHRVSVGPGGWQPAKASAQPAISAGGRYVVFSSRAGGLVHGDTNRVCDVFVRDRLRHVTERVSVGSAEQEGNGASGVLLYGDQGLAVSDHGRYVAFFSRATNLVRGDTNGYPDVFVRDRIRGVTRLVSVGVDGQPANQASGVSLSGVSLLGMSANGRYVTFGSRASNLIAADSNRVEDIFVRDMCST